MMRPSAFPCFAILVCLFSFFTPDPTHAREIPFGTARDVDASWNGAADLALGDVDLDGNLDVVSAGRDVGRVAVWRYVAGTWLESTIDLSITQPTSVTIADLDQDGDADVAVGTGSSGSLTWYENTDGSGSAWSESAIASYGSGALDVAVGDIDGDGHVDLITAVDGTSHEIAWWRQQPGIGISGTASVIATGFTGASSVFAVDMDLDGDADVVATAADANTVRWFENTAGDGSAWSAHDVDTSATGAADVKAGDIDGDGDPDLVAALEGEDTLAFYENQGGGSSWSARNIDASFDAGAVELGDADMDGDTDVIATAITDDQIAWYENTDALGTTWISHSILDSAGGPEAAAFGDIDGDGDMDAAAAVVTDDAVYWFDNTTPHGNAAFLDTHPAGDFDGALSIAEVDMDSDGDTDLVAGSDDEVAWWANPGDGAGGTWTKTSITTGFTDAATLAVADWDGDGDPDVMAAARNGGEVAWWKNTAGDGSAWTETSITTTALMPFVFGGDIDGDGDPDALVLERDGDEINWWENQSGDGSTWVERSLDGTRDGPHRADLADYDEDGDLDVVVASAIGDTLDLFENTGGDGLTWSRTSLDDDFNGAIWAQFGDMDNDGDLDVAAMAANLLQWWANPGSGSTWFERTVFVTSSTLKTGNLTDIDHDGDSDILVMRSISNQVQVYFNDANGTSWNRIFAGLFQFPNAALAVDLDGDGDRDLAAVSSFVDQVAWLPNIGGQLALPTTDLAPALAIQGTSEDILSIQAIHNGRAGDSDATLRALTLLVEEADGDPLTQAEAEALIASIEIYRDHASNGTPGSFDGADTLIAAIDSLPVDGSGLLSVPFEDDAVGAAVAQGEPATLFVVASLAADGAGSTPSTFQIGHGSSAPSSAEIFGTDIPMSLETMATVSSTNLLVDADSDTDSLPDSLDNCPLISNPDQQDTDMDAVGEVCDNCPDTANTDQADPDADTLGSACDNCPAIANMDQADADLDTIGDLCDPCNVAGDDDLLRLELDYNYNGIAHEGEENDPDAADGFRAFDPTSALAQRQGLLDSGISPLSGLAYQTVDQAFVVDMIFLGMRSFDDAADTDNIGTQPDWLTELDQTTVASSISPRSTLGADSEIGLLYHAAYGGGTFDITLGFDDGTSVTVTLQSPGWLTSSDPDSPGDGVALQANYGEFYGHYIGELAFPSGPVWVREAVISGSELSADLGFEIAGKIPSSVIFANGTNSWGHGIFAMTIDDSPVDLEWNWNGQVHDLEDEDPNAAMGYRSIFDWGVARSERYLFRDPTSDYSGLSYRTVDTAGTLDMIHVGNRSQVGGFDASADGDQRGTQPDWLPEPDQSTVTTSISPTFTATNDTTIGILYHAGGSGGQFDVTLEFTDTSSVTVTLDAAFWQAQNGDVPEDPLPGVAYQENLRAFYGTRDQDLASVGYFLLVHEALLTRNSLLAGKGFDMAGRELSAITFGNRSDDNGFGIYAVSASGSFDFDGDGVGGACELCIGDDASGDGDGDGTCADLDCNDADADLQSLNGCGECSPSEVCALFADGFESGDTVAWQ